MPQTVMMHFPVESMPEDYDPKKSIFEYIYEELRVLQNMHQATIDRCNGAFGCKCPEIKDQAEKARMWIQACEKAMIACENPMTADWACTCGTPLLIRDIITCQEPLCPACRAKYYYVM